MSGTDTAYGATPELSDKMNIDESWVLLSSYAVARPSLVLTSAMLLPGVYGGVVPGGRTEAGVPPHYDRRHEPLHSGASLQPAALHFVLTYAACYAMFGTDLAHGITGSQRVRVRAGRTQR
eukprot:1290519-Rhodomonas_salina.4